MKKVRACDRVTFRDVLCLNGAGYRKRAARIFGYAVVLLLIDLLLAGLMTVCILSFSGEGYLDNAALSALSSAAGVAYPVSIDDDGLHANAGTTDEVTNENGEPVEDAAVKDIGTNKFDLGIFIPCVIGALLVSFAGMVFSGAFASVFLRPVNCIKFAPAMVLRRRLDGENSYENVLSARLWICLPSDVYLYDVQVSVNHTRKGRYADNELPLAFTSAVNTNWHITSGSYAMLRGVWNIDIPLNSIEADALLAGLSEVNKNPKVQILVQGRTSSGEVVSKEKLYHRSHILPGYNFAAYEREAFCKRRGIDPKSAEANPDKKRYSYGSFAKVEKDCEFMEAIARERKTGEWYSILNEDALTGHEVDCRNNALAGHVEEPSDCWNPHWTHGEKKEIEKL